MANYIQRKTYFSTNKYQRRILYLTFVPSLIICVCFTFMAVIFHRELIDVILHESEVVIVNYINQWGVFILTLLWTLFILILIWAYIISKNLVGAFIRVIRELDDVIAGKRRRHISARVKDDLANELLKRINILIDRMLASGANSSKK